MGGGGGFKGGVGRGGFGGGGGGGAGGGGLGGGGWLQRRGRGGQLLQMSQGARLITACGNIGRFVKRAREDGPLGVAKSLGERVMKGLPGNKRCHGGCSPIAPDEGKDTYEITEDQTIEDLSKRKVLRKQSSQATLPMSNFSGH
ncbi:uncharacterized protein LOC131858025 [Cryptomeria japonica]|uniref:uncharacterized protein LOC131858025 n=1 Tax=Cryptomeria japonica TaxID=3369 RepID=UPI0027DA8C8C|nr:uncharacterized protein LOC131858025 [Cryptomeria japonica]